MHTHTQENTVPKRTKMAIAGSLFRSNAPFILAIIIGVGAIELIAPPKRTPSYFIGWLAGGLDQGQLDRERAERAETERQLAMAQKEAEIALAKAQAEFQTAMQIAVAEATAEANAEAQIEVAMYQDAANRMTQRLASVNAAQQQAATTMMQQVDKTTGFRIFEANVTDGICAMSGLLGDDFGACAWSDQIREDIAEPVIASLDVFKEDTSEMMNGLVDPSQLIVDRELRAEYGRINKAPEKSKVAEAPKKEVAEAVADPAKERLELLEAHYFEIQQRRQSVEELTLEELYMMRDYFVTGFDSLQVKFALVDHDKIMNEIYAELSRREADYSIDNSDYLGGVY